MFFGNACGRSGEISGRPDLASAASYQSWRELQSRSWGGAEQENVGEKNVGEKNKKRENE
jgi:hypothetical protein